MTMLLDIYVQTLTSKTLGGPFPSNNNVITAGFVCYLQARLSLF